VLVLLALHDSLAEVKSAHPGIMISDRISDTSVALGFELAQRLERIER